jgi:hypothetical protein
MPSTAAPVLLLLIGSILLVGCVPPLRTHERPERLMKLVLRPHGLVRIAVKD